MTAFHGKPPGFVLRGAFMLALAVAAASPVLVRPLPAVAQTSQAGTPVALDGITLAFGPVTYRIPHAEVLGSPLSRDDLMALLDPASALPVAERIARFRAAEIRIPEMTSDFATAGGRQVTTYRDVVVTGVEAGRVASLSMGRGSVETAEAAAAGRAEFESARAEAIDLGLLASLAGPAPSGTTASEAPLKPLYGSFTMEKIKTTDPTGRTTRIDTLGGRDFRARPTAEGWGATFGELMSAPDPKGASPAERKRVLGQLVDLMGAVDVGALTASGISFSGPDGSDEGTGRIARIDYASGRDGRASELRLDGFEAGSKDGRVRVGSLTLSGLSLTPTLAALRDMAGTGPGELSQAEMRRLVPMTGSLRLGNIDIDLPRAPGDPTAVPLRVAIGAVELAADKPVENVPSDLRVAFRNISFAVPPNPASDALKQFATLGYDRVDLSLAASANWDPDARQLVVRELSLDGAGMGSVNLRAVLGNVSRDLFAPNETLAMVALAGATAKSLHAEIDDRGLLERVLAREAKRQDRSVDDVRREYGMAAAIGIPILLGNDPAAKTLGAALARFVAKPDHLSIDATAKQDGGIGLVAFLVSPEPAEILSQLNVKASAN